MALQHCIWPFSYNLPIVEALIPKGADPRECDDIGETPLALAIRTRNCFSPMIKNMLRIFRNILQFYVLLSASILHGLAEQNVVYENKIAAHVEDRVMTTQQVKQEAIRSEASHEKA
ncbi:MAG: hypothetical protein LBC30_02640, partial [Puniceicoccales bacterium]|nr:hypothetical protein [Puniceicoccales bacterium]